MRVEREKKPRKCPVCGHSTMSSIIYGLVGYDEELERKRKEGRISYGGCCITLDDPAWECTKCGLKVYKKDFA